jgi:hypothetical protein
MSIISCEDGRNDWPAVAHNFNSDSGFTPMPEMASVTPPVFTLSGAFERTRLFYPSRSVVPQAVATVKHDQTMRQQPVVARSFVLFFREQRIKQRLIKSRTKIPQILPQNLQICPATRKKTGILGNLCYSIEIKGLLTTFVDSLKMNRERAGILCHKL